MNRIEPAFTLQGKLSERKFECYSLDQIRALIEMCAALCEDRPSDSTPIDCAVAIRNAAKELLPC